MARIASLHDRLWRRCSATERLLLACMRQRPDAAAGGRIAAAAADAATDWQAALRLSVAHQVAPLLLHTAAAAGVAGRIPDQVRAALHHETLRNMAAKAAMRTAMLDVVDSCRGLGLAVMAVKGTALDLRLYDEPWLTTSGDVDLIVGCRPEACGPELYARLVAWNAATPAVDVHCHGHPDIRIDGAAAVDFAAVWSAAGRTTVDGRDVALMCPVHELLTACIQAARRRFFRLKSLLETSELVRRGAELDWDLLAGTARAWRCGGLAYAALTASAAAAGDLPVPPDLAARLGIGRGRAALLDGLIGRMSLASLSTLGGGLRLGGRRLGPGALLPWLALGWRGRGRALRRGWGYRRPAGR